MESSLTLGPPGAQTSTHTGAQTEHPDLVQWLRSGRLTLVNSNREPLTEDAWHALPLTQRQHALDQFDRVVRSNTKAAVIFIPG